MENKNWERKRPQINTTVAQETLDYLKVYMDTLSISKGYAIDYLLSYIENKCDTSKVMEYIIERITQEK